MVGRPAGLEKLEIYPPQPQAEIEAGAWAELGNIVKSNPNSNQAYFAQTIPRKV